MAKVGKIFIGTSGWNYGSWRGIFYPVNLKSQEYLGYYAKFFRTTEVNYSFYHLPRPSTYQNWYGHTPKDFIFALKASRFITHIKRLKGVKESWQLFLNNALVLQEKLGPILFQLPPSFKMDTKILDSFLKSVNKKSAKLAFEFRHPTWFNDMVYKILNKHDAALVIADSSRYPKPPKVVVTARFAYFRFHGPEALFASSYTRKELKEWADKMKEVLKEGFDVYAYFNNDVAGYAVENAKTLISLL